MRAGIYLRVSEDRTGEELAVGRQGDDARALADRRDWTVAREYVDNDVSAAGKVQRPAFLALVEDIRAGQLDAVVAWAFDRLCRNARDRLTLIEACRERNVIIALVRGSDIDLGTPSGRLTAGILGEVAQMEIDTKGDRTRRANEQAAAAGKPPGGPVPFGFMPDRITHHPAQAAAIEQGYHDLLAGASLAGIARRWNDEGLLSGRPRVRAQDRGTPSPWRAETVRMVLLNARNAGLREYKGELHPAKWEPIAPEETWRAATALLKDPSRRVAPPSAKRLLSGVALCGTCGSRLNAGTSRRTLKGETYFAYRCRSSLGHVGRRGDLIDEYITDLVVHRLARPDAVALLQTLSQHPQVDAPALRAEATALRTKLETVALEFADDDAVTPAQLRVMTRRIRANLTEVENTLVEAGRVNILASLVGAEDVGAVWEELHTDKQRAVIDTLLMIVVYPVGRGARVFDPATIWTRWRDEIS